MAYMYSLPERLADGTIHLVGIASSITATVVLILYAAQAHGNAEVVAVSVYGAVATLCFLASALYHMTPWAGSRSLFQRIDHAAIYLKIAGTYTPLVVIMGSVFAYVVLAVIWAVALVCAAGKLTERLRPGVLSTLVYAALGWAAVILIWPMADVVPAAALWLMLAGGIAYTLGAPINHLEGLRFNVAIWHGFVLAGSGFFFAAILLSLAAVGA